MTRKLRDGQERYQNNHMYGTSGQRPEVFIPPTVPTVPENTATPGPRRPGVRRRPPRRGSGGRRRRFGSRRVWAVVLLIFIIWGILRIAPVPFGKVTIQGNSQLTTADVYRAAGVGAPINVIQLSPSQMEKRLHEDLRIGTVSVSRRFPATIVVQLSERRPIAVVMTMFGFAYVDPTGMIMASGAQIKGASVPIITGKKVDTVLLGDTLTDAAVQGALQYLHALPASVQGRITEVNVANPQDIIAYTGDGTAIHLGKGDVPQERAKITGELLRQAGEQRIAVQYVDTDPSAPIIKN